MRVEQRYEEKRLRADVVPHNARHHASRVRLNELDAFQPVLLRRVCALPRR